jgi:hypothetical protein
MLNQKPSVRRALIGGAVGLTLAMLCTVGLRAIKQIRLSPEEGFNLVSTLYGLLSPEKLSDWLSLFGVFLFGVITALIAAATGMARSSK